MALLTNELQPDSGTITLQGKVALLRQVELENSRKTLTVSDQGDLTAEEWLEERAMAEELDFDYVHKILRATRISADSTVRNLSHGQQVRFVAAKPSLLLSGSHFERRSIEYKQKLVQTALVGDFIATWCWTAVA